MHKNLAASLLSDGLRIHGYSYGTMHRERRYRGSAVPRWIVAALFITSEGFYKYKDRDLIKWVSDCTYLLCFPNVYKLEENLRRLLKEKKSILMVMLNINFQISSSKVSLRVTTMITITTAITNRKTFLNLPKISRLRP